MIKGIDLIVENDFNEEELEFKGKSKMATDKRMK